MKISKKHAAIFFLVIYMLIGFSGCAKRGACEECGQIETLNKFVEADGDIRWYCNDCYRLAKIFS